MKQEILSEIMIYQGFKKAISIIALTFYLVSLGIAQERNAIFNEKQILNKYGFSLEKAKSQYFIISKTEDPKPVLIFIRGSDFAPLFVNGESIMFPFDIKKYQKDFNIVVLPKPGIPVFSDSTQSKFINETYTQGYYLDNSAQVPAQFVKNNNLQYYVDRYSEVIDYLRKQPYVQKDKIYLIGHSQGANVALSTALKNKRISKIALLATHVGDRFTEATRKIRNSEQQMRISSQEAQVQIDSLYKSYLDLYQNRDNNDKLFDSNTYFSYASFTFPNISTKLMALKTRALLVYGTNSVQDIDCDEFRYELIKKQKSNIIVKPYIGLDHNFFEIKEDKATGKMEKIYNWDKVFRDTVNWLKQN
ncbi:alpha/beta fold hydrolase [Emticicia soli]|uniref:Alpha/beta fold hydrolase n=1 Tax=Emticicia soli TaxID=2027878 RepID=A0ABW5J1B3_9BACT